MMLGVSFVFFELGCVVCVDMLLIGLFGSFDLFFKKYMIFINKFKFLFLVGFVEVLIKDIDGLILVKYLDEIVVVVVEGVVKKGDLEVVVDVSKFI